VNLYEKMKTTEPGLHAVTLGDLMYDFKYEIEKFGGTELIQRVSKAQHYLEGLAHLELEEQIKNENEWVAELTKKKRERDQGGP